MNEALWPLAAAIPVAAAHSYLRTHRPGPALRSLARPRDLAALTPRGTVNTARRLRGLDTRKPELSECGVLLGVLQPRGPRLYSSFEETILAVMGPRAGHKTTGLAIPTVLGAPGPVLATSNKADLWMATAALRAEPATGRRDKRPDTATAAESAHGAPPSAPPTVWTFDPQQIARADQTWWWDPLADLTTVEAAQRLAGMFVQSVDDSGPDTFWTKSARALLTTLFAAAHHARAPVGTVWRWLTDPASIEPGELLRDHQQVELAQSFEGLNGQHPRTRDSIYITAQVAADCLANRHITGWVTPAPGLPRFQPADFVGSRDSVYLLSKDGGGSAGPLVAALTDAVLRAAVHTAERAGGRLDPPLLAVLDEAANVCRIADLPLLYSHFGSRGESDSLKWPQ